MTERLKLGIAHIPITCDPVANGATVRRTMRAAAAESARLVHFPEGALSGYPGTPTAKRELALHRARPWRTAARLAYERRSLGAR
jgi:predicted amidohydrolase